ncbi:coiled-coil domain-containing protein 66 isoform X3 [Anabas testudineus]|uniref:coiled-coil domain-containing protein 66 isoform X3 n=1 Tax=Anabas testudineus TaxID=64144 RepID=UPI000E4566E4|nr:coiled-coil domain-containing protein 66 isoform X3 [Anabas testudineus]
MNLGDGLLFELENGKPKLILLSHGVEKNPKKQPSFRPRAANILSSRQPSYVEEVEEERPVRHQAARHRAGRSKVEGAATSFTSNTAKTAERSTNLTSSKTNEIKGGDVKAVAKVKSEGHKHSSAGGALRSNKKTGQPQKVMTLGSRKDTLASGNTGSKDSVVCLTSEQLQQILNTVETSNNGHHLLENHRTEVNGRGGHTKQEDSGGGEDIKNEGEGGVTDTTRSSQDKDNRLSGCLFSWLEEQSDSRAAIDAKRAQWRRELDEQVALKQQQRSAPGRLQAEEDRDSVLSVQSSISHREQPAAIKSSLKLGDVMPMEEVLSVERREEQRRRWLDELDRQREEMTERRRREKLLQSQTEDHELWATHFDSLQRRPPVQTVAPSAPSAPPPAPSNGSERGEWEPSSSLSLVWDTSSCGAESVGAVSVDITSGYQNKASYVRTMTALLDPTQIEERERRRLKQLEQQRAIEAQVEERRRQREQEEARRREEEEEDERRVSLEREMLQRQYELDSLRERQKVGEQQEQTKHQAELSKKVHSVERLQETLEPGAVTRQGECLEDAVIYKDTAVQTEAAPSEGVSAQYRTPAPPHSRSRAMTTGKENICLQVGGGGGGDPYEAFARTDRSRRDKRRPEWNTQRPSRRFVPASERYPASLQRNRQESRLKRQAELLALQERACLSRTEPAPQNQEPRLCSNPTQTRTSPNRKVECVSNGQNISAAVHTERGRSPPVPAVRHRVQSRQASSPSPSVLEFIPYVRTDEVFNLDPLEPADTPLPDTYTDPPKSSASVPAPSHRDALLHPELLRNTHTHRQQEILRGLAQLRQGLLQKQKELETDLNPLLKRHDNELRPSSATHRM